MQQCLIYDKSLRFSRATYGVLVLVAYFTRSQWLILAVSLLVIIGAFSFKLNIPYQIHRYFSKKSNKKTIEHSPREVGELNFVAGATGMLLLIGFLLLYFDKYVNFAWVYLLVVTLMIFLACFVGFCVATMMYVLLKKIFSKKGTLQ